MRVLHFERDGICRSVNPVDKPAVFVFKGKLRTARSGCAVTHVCRLMEAGWRLVSIDDDPH